MNTAHLIAMSETEWQDLVVEYATLRRWTVMHVRRSIKGEAGGWTTTTSVSGWPDLVLWRVARTGRRSRSGGILYRELKSEKGRLTVDQLDVLGSLSDAGGDVDIWRPSDWPTVQETLQ